MLRTTVAAAVGAASLALLVAVPANASVDLAETGSVDVNYYCEEEPYGGAETVLVVSLTTPRRVNMGRTFVVEATVTTTTPAPEGLRPNSLIGEIEVVAGGVGDGTVEATGLTNPVVPPAGDPLTLSGGRAAFTADTPGVWTFRPGVFETINELNQHLVCTPTSTPPEAARVLVR